MLCHEQLTSPGRICSAIENSLRRDVGILCRIEEEARDLRVGLGLPHVQFVPVMLAERLRVDADDPGMSGSGMP